MIRNVWNPIYYVDKAHSKFLSYQGHFHKRSYNQSFKGEIFIQKLYDLMIPVIDCGITTSNMINQSKMYEFKIL